MKYTRNILFSFILPAIFMLLAPDAAPAGDAVSFAPTLPPWRLRQQLQETDSVIQNGLRAMRSGYFSVTDKRNLPHGIDPHNYRSLAPYWWPNPATRDGLPYIRKAGQSNPAAFGRNFDAMRFRNLAETVSALALSYRLTADKAAARRAAELLRIWFIKPETRMLPNMATAYIHPGPKGDAEDAGRDISAANMIGSPEGLIEARYLITLCDAMTLLDNDLIWTAQDKTAVENWLTDFRHWQDTSSPGAAHRSMTNHHGTWDDALHVALALFLGDVDGAGDSIKRHSLPRIAEQFQPDGSQPKELVGADSLHDSIFNLEAWATLAVMGQRLGIDVWHHTAPNGASIDDGLRFLLGYRDHPERWTWSQQSAFDPSRLDALVRTIHGLEQHSTDTD